MQLSVMIVDLSNSKQYLNNKDTNKTPEKNSSIVHSCIIKDINQWNYYKKKSIKTATTSTPPMPATKKEQLAVSKQQQRSIMALLHLSC